MITVPFAPLHCTISFFIKGGSIFTTEFINRFMLCICLLFDFYFKLMKNRDSEFLEILCLMLAEWWMLRSTTRKGLSCLSW